MRALISLLLLNVMLIGKYILSWSCFAISFGTCDLFITLIIIYILYIKHLYICIVISVHGINKLHSNTDIKYIH